ncbi:MAG TPA: flagellar biosynthesis anti-sigma factor FlgM [Acidobacteriaceae bacterium]|nr:flagellar biosynthesis anti-sigma factor FlgM [Acidobacteriaceae bacterium]
MNISHELQTARAMTSQIEVAATRKASDAPVVEPESSQSDQAHLSGAAALVSQAVSAPDVRQEKVTAVQAAIVNGTYSVKSSDVAQSVIDHMMGNKD